MSDAGERGTAEARERQRHAIDLQAVSAALHDRRARLLAEASDLDLEERALGEARDFEGGPGTDSADIATDLAGHEIAEALEHNARGQLFEVDQALKRLETARYGVCEECGASIDPARLKALPWARLCLDCQRRVESGR